MMTLNLKNKKITNIEVKKTSFNKELCSGRGTILYGTNFYVNETNCFNIENLYYLPISMEVSAEKTLMEKIEEKIG